MNPIWFVLKVAGMAMVTAVGAAVLTKKFAPKPSDLMAGALHIRKGVDEFQKGLSTILFGAADSSADKAGKEKKESSRIPIV